MKWLLFLDLDGTFWDHLDVSSTAPPFVRISRDTIRDQKGITLTIKPGALDLISWVKSNDGILSSCSWNTPDIALLALEALDAARLFDYQRISTVPRKDLLMEDLLDYLRGLGIVIAQHHIFYLDDRDIHMTEIRKRFPELNFLHMWKKVKSFDDARLIISRVLKE